MPWRLYNASRFRDVQGVWDSINASSGNLPIQDACFYQRLLEQFGRGDETLAICEDGSRPIAAALLRRSRLGLWQTFQPSQAPLGPWLQTTDVATEDVLGTLARALPGHCVLLSATHLDPDIVPRPRDRAQVETLEYIETARVTLRGTFADYWSSRGTNLQHNLRRQRNRLAREGTTTRFEWLTNTDAVGAAVDAYGELESSGWKAAHGTAIHPANSQGRFYRALMERYASRGEACVFRYFFNDRLVACDLCLKRNGVLILLKTTRDESQKTTSPSYLMREESMRALFEHGGFRRVEFYGRRMAWHTRWSTEFRHLFHVNYFRWKVAGSIYRNVHRLRAE
jgi:CelD/BcsL family acetyltransferase involved in cellulose biosynthesis